MCITALLMPLWVHVLCPMSQVSYSLYDPAQTWDRFKVRIPEDSVTLYQEDAVGSRATMHFALSSPQEAIARSPLAWVLWGLITNGTCSLNGCSSCFDH